MHVLKGKRREAVAAAAVFRYVVAPAAGISGAMSWLAKLGYHWTEQVRTLHPYMYGTSFAGGYAERGFQGRSRYTGFAYVSRSYIQCCHSARSQQNTLSSKLFHRISVNAFCPLSQNVLLQLARTRLR